MTAETGHHHFTSGFITKIGVPNGKNAQHFSQTICVEHDNSLIVFEFKRVPSGDQDS